MWVYGVKGLNTQKSFNALFVKKLHDEIRNHVDERILKKCPCVLPRATGSQEEKKKIRWKKKLYLTVLNEEEYELCRLNCNRSSGNECTHQITFTTV